MLKGYRDLISKASSFKQQQYAYALSANKSSAYVSTERKSVAVKVNKRAKRNYKSHKTNMSVVDKVESSNKDPSRYTSGIPSAGGGRIPNEHKRAGKSRAHRNGARMYDKKVFKGETAGLNGAVFTLQDESKDSTQFDRTMELLRDTPIRPSTLTFLHCSTNSRCPC